MALLLPPDYKVQHIPTVDFLSAELCKKFYGRSLIEEITRKVIMPPEDVRFPVVGCDRVHIRPIHEVVRTLVENLDGDH